MTPQLQQAIRLLQLSTVELQMEIQSALESNLMLESPDEENTKPEETLSPESEQASSQEDSADETRAESTTETIPEELPVDSNWEDTYDTGIISSGGAPDADNRDFLDSVNSATTSLHDHLNWQLDLSTLSPTDQLIANTIIDAINDDGYLGTSIDELADSLATQQEVEVDEVEAVLHRIQQFDPIGVGARNPGECLLIQLQNMDPETPWLPEALLLIREHLGLLGSRDYNQIMRRMKLSQPDLQEVLHLIQSLNPRPGAQFADTSFQYIVPDVFVFKRKGEWVVELNMDAAPRLRINSQYANMVRRGDNSQDNNYMKNHLQEARWFLKSLQSRHETLLKVANSIVARQRGFLDYGEEAMKPLVLRSIADEVNMHESTVSRVTTSKYMHTPRGIYEFIYFFSSHVGTEDGGECSASAIRALIKKLVAAENPQKPLSDNKITGILSEQGIKVARRTIAKYREAMSILPSNERKRMA